MSWRTVVIQSRAKLEYKLGFLVVRSQTIQKIHLSEIAVLIVESTGVSVTAALLNELVAQKVKVIFCDQKRNPSFELAGYYGSHDTSEKLRRQMRWEDEIKGAVWREIVQEKIAKQGELLREMKKEQEARLLEQYAGQVEDGDRTNREGHAAKVYFNGLFGREFLRGREDPVNAALNYGYAILLSAVNREIVASGYVTQIGIFHDNMFNRFNLGSDLMEPFRPLVDRVVVTMAPEEFEREERMALVNLLNHEVVIDGRRNYLPQALKIYVKSVLDAMEEKDPEQIRFYRNELSIYENDRIF